MMVREVARGLEAGIDRELLAMVLVMWTPLGLDVGAVVVAVLEVFVLTLIAIRDDARLI